MFFVAEVHDAQGRIVPITENDVTFAVKGAGRILGTGNGDPTNHQPDTGSSRKAFAGLCMAVVQAGKTAGTINVEATSPGLAAATATITSKAVQLRPQVAVWEREVPVGAGVTGLWRPVMAANAAPSGDPMMLAGGNADIVFSLRQEGGVITGYVENAAPAGFGGGLTGGPIEEGKIDGTMISFKAGPTTYTGTIKGAALELMRNSQMRRPGSAPPAASNEPRPAIGPPPDGTDPSFGAGFGGRRGGAPAPLMLRRVRR